MEVVYAAALRTLREGRPALERLPTKCPLSEMMTDGIAFYCSNCSRRFFTSGSVLQDAINKRQSWLTLEHEGFLHDPLGVLRRRTAR